MALNKLRKSIVVSVVKLFRMKRGLLIQERKRKVTLDDVCDNLPQVIERVNAIQGPQVKFDPKRCCYGLYADRDYDEGELVTLYGGVKYSGERSGDYVSKIGKHGNLHIDGHYGFTQSEKGRWINESNRCRNHVNVELGRSIRTTQDVKRGDQFFADYGDEYARTY